MLRQAGGAWEWHRQSRLRLTIGADAISAGLLSLAYLSTAIVEDDKPIAAHLFMLALAFLPSVAVAFVFGLAFFVAHRLMFVRAARAKAGIGMALTGESKNHEYQIPSHWALLMIKAVTFVCVLLLLVLMYAIASQGQMNGQTVIGFARAWECAALVYALCIGAELGLHFYAMRRDCRRVKRIAEMSESLKRP